MLNHSNSYLVVRPPDLQKLSLSSSTCFCCPRALWIWGFCSCKTWRIWDRWFDPNKQTRFSFWAYFCCPSRECRTLGADCLPSSWIIPSCSVLAGKVWCLGRLIKVETMVDPPFVIHRLVAVCPMWREVSVDINPDTGKSAYSSNNFRIFIT